MRNVLLFFMAAWACGIQAQPGFGKAYALYGSVQLVQLGSGNLLVGGTWSATGATLMDPEGNVLGYNSYWGVLGVAQIAQRAENELYFASGYLPGGSCPLNGTWTTPIQAVIGKMDTLANVTALDRYQLNGGCQTLAVDLEVTDDSCVVAWGGTNNFFAMKVGSDLNPIWSKLFDRRGNFEFIRELPGGDLLAGISMDTAGAVVARMDADGNFLWCKSYIRPSGLVRDCVIESDSSFVIAGITDVQPATTQKLFMLKLNGAGDVQWCKGYDIDSYWGVGLPTRMERASDGNYVVLAPSGDFRPFLMKTDQNGDTLWTRSVIAAGYGFATSDLLAASDGGYLITGIVSGDFPDGHSSLSYIFKADSLGHLPCDESWDPIQITDLFPIDSSFTLTSIDGATTIPISVSDTIFPPITVYDACLVTSVPPTPHISKFRVFPNPNTGRFTVEFKDPLGAESYYSVYDALGKLLYQRPLPPGATIQEVDLSRFGKGTYVITCTDPEGVSYEQVVLE